MAYRGRPDTRRLRGIFATVEATLIKRYRGETELYDLRNDTLQLQNLSGNSDYASLESDLLEHMERLMSQRNDGFFTGQDKSLPALNHCGLLSEKSLPVLNHCGLLGEKSLPFLNHCGLLSEKSLPVSAA